MYARVFRSFEETSGGLWRCKHCPYTIQKRELDAMFDHLKTAHWKSSKPNFSILIPQNHTDIEDNSSMNPSTDTQQETNDVSNDITTHLMHTDLPNTSKTIAQDGPRLLSGLGKDYEAGKSLLKSRVSLGGVKMDANSIKQPKVKIHLPNGHEIEGFVLGSIFEPENYARSNDLVNLANNYVNDKVQTAASSILLEKPSSSSNLQKIIEETIEQTFRNHESNSRILLRDDMRKSDFPYSRESDTDYPRPTKVQRTLTEMETCQSTGNDSGRMEEENPEPVEEEVQVIMQKIPSSTTDVQANKNGQISMSYEFIKTEKAGEKKNVAVITLNRPKALNALCNKLLDELDDAVTKFDGDDGIGAIIITGSERAFAAGTDIKEVANQTHAQAIKENVLGNWNGILRASKPMIAAVNGYALGGGCELAMMCDIIYAGEKAHFGQPEIVIGTIPRAGGTQRLTRVVGKSKAMEMMLTGNQISAVEAEKSGLVSKVFPPEELLSEAIKLGERISTHSQLIVSMAKEAVNSAYETKLQEGLRLEKKIYCGTLATADRKEGMAAFIEKRAPEFKNE